LEADFLAHPGWLAAPMPSEPLLITNLSSRTPPPGSSLYGSGQGVRQGTVADRLLIAPKRVMSKFTATTYSVGENAGTFIVTELRTGNTGAAATVQYSNNGTGTANRES
jgi:hypothetical protein